MSDFIFPDFKKGLMLAGLVSPANEQEQREKDILTNYELNNMEQINGYMVLYTTINQENGEEVRTDCYNVFIDDNAEVRARTFFDEIKEKEDTYSASLTVIIDSTEPHYLNIQPKI